MDVKGKIDKAKSLGVCRTLKMPAVKWKKREKGCGMVTSPARKKLLDRIFDREYSRIIIFENHFGYYNIMMQRPQHLLKNMADHDTLVLYNSTDPSQICLRLFYGYGSLQPCRGIPAAWIPCDL